MDGYRRNAFIGTGPAVAQRIRDLAAQTGAVEMAIVTWAYDEAVRVHSYQLIADAFGMGAGVVRGCGCPQCRPKLPG